MMIPFDALKKILAFVKAPTLGNVGEAMQALSEVMTWVGTVWDVFKAQPHVALAGGDPITTLETGLAELESQSADVKMGFPSWLLPIVLEVVKKLIDRLGQK